MAITPYNYANPQKTVPTTGSGIKPYVYATPTSPAPAPAQIPPSLFSKLGDRAKETGGNILAALTNTPAKKTLDMQSALEQGWNAISTTVQDTSKRLENLSAVSPYVSPGSKESRVPKTLEQNAAAGRAVLGLINTAFLGVTAPLEATRGVPIVGHVADAVSNLFGALGAGGAGVASGAVDALPFSDKTNEKIRPLAEEVGALLAQIAAGKLGEFSIAKVKTKAQSLTEAVHEGVVETKASLETKPTEVGTPAEATIPPFDYTKSAAEQHSAYAKSQGYEPYTPHDQLPTIEAGKTVKETLPTIQTEPAASTSMGDLTVEPIKTPYYHGADIATAAKIKEGGFQGSKDFPGNGMVSLTTDAADASHYAELNGKGEVLPVKISGDRIKTYPSMADYTKAVEAAPGKTAGEKEANLNKNYDLIKIDGEKTVFANPDSVSVDAPKGKESGTTFTSRVFERLRAENPEALAGDLKVDSLKLTEDAQRAVDLVEKDKQEAFDIAMGAKSSAEVTSTATNIALAERALQEGNHDLYARLIKNRSLAQTRRGQEIVSERGSVTDNSTSRYVKELVAARLDSFGKGYLSDLTGRRVSDKTKAIKKMDAEVSKVEKQIKAKKLDTKTALALLDKLSCV